MKNMTVTDGAEQINRIAEAGTILGSKESIYAITSRVAKSLSDDPIFNLAAYMKYAFGPCLSGERDVDWVVSAAQANDILSTTIQTPVSKTNETLYHGSPSWKE